MADVLIRRGAAHSTARSQQSQLNGVGNKRAENVVRDQNNANGYICIMQNLCRIQSLLMNLSHITQSEGV